jgi:CheY-like chemotaxis protein
MAIREQAQAADPLAVIPPTVLLAAGDPDMRLYLRSCLRGPAAPPARVLEAADGLDALRLVRSGGVDLVIADMALPGLDGRRLRRALGEDPALTRVAVLLLDAEATGGECAADGVLAGPFNGRRLLGALRALTRGPPPP